jgi:hypothetical protein
MGNENGSFIFPRLSVTNREYGTRASLRLDPAGTIFPKAISTTIRNLIALFSQRTS